MHRTIAALAFLLGYGVASATALAGDSGPVIVIPGKPGVPVMINGYDASYAVVEGDWGLYRPGHVAPTIVSGPLFTPAPVYFQGYYPAFGRRPGYGRHEIEPPANRRLPTPAESFHRFWGASSDSIPATLDPPANPPPVIVAPRFGDRGPHH